MSGSVRRPSHRQASATTSILASEDVAMSESSSSAPPRKQGPASVAIDLGSYSIRICITGAEGKPPIITRCPNALVKPSQKRYSGASGSGLLAGPQIKQHCTNFGSLSIRQPMDRGMIIDWPTQKLILDAALMGALGQEKSGSKSDQRLLEGREVIVTEAYLNMPDLQAGLDILFFEGYGASKIWRCAPALLIPYQPSLFTSKAAGKRRSRPECMCIIDLGHNATHVVPVMGDTIVWNAVRRSVISQRILTNLLKETLSFRQWDMMDEPWLVGHIKERCCFVASKAGRRGDIIDLEADRPSSWSYAGMIEMCQDLPQRKNPLVVEYILPDYSPSSKEKLGYVRSRKSMKDAADDLDTFIASGTTANGAHSAKEGQKSTSDNEEEDDDSGDDFHEGSPNSPAPKKTKVQKVKAAVSKDEEESEQVLILERERFQIPEVMFDPGIIGLDDAPLHQVIESSIQACDEELQGLFWANIVLVGGGAKMAGLKNRIINELRPLAPANIPMQVWIAEDPSLSAIQGAQAMLDQSSRILRPRYLSSGEYTIQASREKFGSWSGSTASVSTSYT